MSANKWRQYAYLKEQYMNQHPNCTPLEYEAACRRFVEMLGI